jgi:hypothetical protein
MLNIPLTEILARMPIAEIEQALAEFLAPMIALSPDKRLRRIVLEAIRGPVHFEKAYTEKSEGVSTIYKSTPPDLNGNARLSRGYPAMTATVVNTPIPAISYASWFSCKTADFVSEDREIERAIRTTQVVFQHAGETRLTNLLAGHPAFSPPSLRRYLRCGQSPARFCRR